MTSSFARKWPSRCARTGSAAAHTTSTISAPAQRRIRVRWLSVTCGRPRRVLLVHGGERGDVDVHAVLRPELLAQFGDARVACPGPSALFHGFKSRQRTGLNLLGLRDVKTERR